jgi:hypothetical protein
VARIEKHIAVSLVGSVGDAGFVPDRHQLVGDQRRVDGEVVAQQGAHRVV